MIFSLKAEAILPLMPSQYPMKKDYNPIKNETPKGRQNRVTRKGRNDQLMEKRNECLVARYYYYGSHSEKRYDIILQQLSDEFFLSTSTIQDLVQSNMKYLHELKDKEPRRAYFESNWPHLVW
jgi:hypothetical protein